MIIEQSGCNLLTLSGVPHLHDAVSSFVAVLKPPKPLLFPPNPLPLLFVFLPFAASTSSILLPTVRVFFEAHRRLLIHPEAYRWFLAYSRGSSIDVVYSGSESHPGLSQSTLTLLSQYHTLP